MSAPAPTHAIPAQTRTPAGLAVYQIPELLQHILRQLDRDDLARFMRVGRRSIPAVARELWGTVNQRDVLALDPTSARHRIYLDAVSVIIVDSPPEQHSPVTGPLEIYTPSLFEALMPPLRGRCPGLKRVEVKRDSRGWPPMRRYNGLPHFENLFWVVEPNRESSHTQAESCAHPEYGDSLDSGKITIVKASCYNPPNSPPPSFNFTNPSPPSSRWALCTRYNLDLTTVHRRGGPEVDPDWLAELAAKRRFRNLYKEVNLGPLPITLKQLGSLYKQQRAAGHVELLEKIVARETAPWSIDDFSRFARRAMSSLSILDLGQNTEGALPFTDLPQLILIIRDHLPHLTELELPLSAGPTMERDCLAWLEEDILERRGTIRKLTVCVPEAALLPVSPLFNTFRLLSPLIAAKSDMRVSYLWGGHGRVCSFLDRMRAQTFACRKQLSTVDFYALGYHDLESFHYFEYDSDGHFRRRVEAEASEWLGIVQTTRDAPQSLFSDYTAGLRAAAAAGEQLRNSTVAAGDTVTLAKMRELLASVKEAEKTGAEVVRIASENVESAEKLGAEIERSIGLMERAEAEADAKGVEALLAVEDAEGPL